MTLRHLILAAALFATPVVIGAQQQAQPAPVPYQPGLSPDAIRKPLAESWPTYSGDYTGRRFSALTQVSRTTVKNLTLAWTARLSNGSPTGGRGAVPMIVGGEGSGEFAAGGGVTLKGGVLAVNDILYVTAPDNVWAMDARDGRVLWQYFWKTKGGTHIGTAAPRSGTTNRSLKRPATIPARSTRPPARNPGTARTAASARSTSPPRPRTFVDTHV